MCINPENLACIFDLKMLSLNIWYWYFIRLLGCQQSHPSVMLAVCSITRCARSPHFRHHCQRNRKPFELSANEFGKYQLKGFWMGQQLWAENKERRKERNRSKEHNRSSSSLTLAWRSEQTLKRVITKQQSCWVILPTRYILEAIALSSISSTELRDHFLSSLSHICIHGCTNK